MWKGGWDGRTTTDTKRKKGRKGMMMNWTTSKRRARKGMTREGRTRKGMTKKGRTRKGRNKQEKKGRGKEG